MQLGLKRASADGGECEDGQKPAKMPRGKAKAKAKGQAKPKASPKGKQRKSAKAKASPKLKVKRARQTKSLLEKFDEAADEGPEQASASVPPAGLGHEIGKPADAAAHEESPPSTAKVARCRAPKGEKSENKSEAVKPGRCKRQSKNQEDLMEKPKETDQDKGDGAKHKCFAKRKRPSTCFGQKRWDAKRAAFHHHVKPQLVAYSVAYSAHEDYLELGSSFLDHTSQLNGPCHLHSFSWPRITIQWRLSFAQHSWPRFTL